MIINLFYKEPDPDRWIKFDRYPRRIIRNILRGRARPGGQTMVFLNLIKGLDKLQVSYRVNEWSYIKSHPKELACIVGKPFLLFDRNWNNPILFGASVFSHPIECPDLFDKYTVRKMLVPGAWMETMCRPFYGAKVQAWPVGIDTDYWSPEETRTETDFLIYNKIRWDHAQMRASMVDPIIQALKQQGFSVEEITYGRYYPEELKDQVGRARAVIFLCEHETQGLAYQQILAMNKPILAWDRGGYWQDPAYYPHLVKFDQGVSSVPYWDDRCGLKFRDYSEFTEQLPVFLNQLDTFKPRQYILENLTLEKCAQAYVDIVKSVQAELIAPAGHG